MQWYLKHIDYFIINIYLSPNKSTNQILTIHENYLKINIKSPPVDGKANKELVSFLASILNINKGNITIKSGLTSRKKVLHIICDYNENLFAEKFGLLF